MITIYLSHRSPDFRKEYFYQALENVRDGLSWRPLLQKHIRIQQQIAEHDHIRIAVVDEDAACIIAYVDLDHGTVVHEQIPPQEDLFD